MSSVRPLELWLLVTISLECYLSLLANVTTFVNTTPPSVHARGGSDYLRHTIP